MGWDIGAFEVWGVRLYLVLDWDRVICLIDTPGWDFHPGCHGRPVVDYFNFTYSLQISVGFYMTKALTYTIPGSNDAIKVMAFADAMIFHYLHSLLLS